mmetsp:Transcript_12634/g.19065  ORF Transcript_12634/g.19065 Transcript_12634/m.19065 type:complete len:97 (+) Transcript_12634:345-635(+)
MNDPGINIAERCRVREEVFVNAATITGLPRTESDVYLKCIKAFRTKRNEEQHPNLNKETCRSVINECFEVGSLEHTAFHHFLDCLNIPENKDEVFF